MSDEEIPCPSCGGTLEWSSVIAGYACTNCGTVHDALPGWDRGAVRPQRRKRNDERDRGRRNRSPRTPERRKKNRTRDQRQKSWDDGF